MAYNIKGDLSVLRRVFSRFIRVETLSGNTGNVLAADNNGDIVSRNVDFFLTGSTIFNDKVDDSTFYAYTSATNTLIGTKLNISDFSSYSANTLNTINNNYSQFTGFTNSFYSYSSNTQNTINNNYSQFTAFTSSFNSYSANTNTLIGTKLDTSVFTAFTNNFYGYTANTQNTINNNYSDFTAFTNSFYGYTGDTNNLINTKLNISDFNSYSANTLNTINNNYSQFTGFTNSFNSYSANTQNQLNNKYDKSGGTISGSVTILGNLIVNGTATTINTQNLLVYDPIIGLALVQSGSTNPTLDSGFIIERGLSGNTGFLWIEANKQFELGYTNNSYNDINVSINQFGNLKVGGLKTNYLYDSLGSTGTTNYILTTTPTGVKWLSGSTNVDISGKLDTSVFTAFTNSFYSYTSNTQNTINNNYSQFTAFTSSFNTFTGTTLPANYFRQGGNSFGASALLGTNDGQSLSFETNGTARMTIASGGTVGINVTPTTARLEIYQSGGTAMNIAGSAGNLLTITDTNTGSLLQVLNSSGNTVFEVGANNYVGITGSTRFVGNIFDFTNSSGNTGNLLTTRQGGVYWSSFDSLLSGSTIYTAFTNSFYGYTAATQNTINNNYSQFTAFTNSFYGYSATTQNTINNNYWALTSLTNTFYTYSAKTDSRLLFSSDTIGSTFRINNNNQASGQYSTVSGGRYNTSSGCYAFIGGGQCNSGIGSYPAISGGRGNLVNGFDGSVNGGVGNYVINNKSSIGGGSINIIGQSSTYSGYWNNTTINILGDVSASFNNNDEVRISNPNDNLFYITTVSVANYNSGIGCTEITFNNPIGNVGNVTFFNRTTSSASGCYNVIGGGSGNISDNIASVVTGGLFNTASGYVSFIGGGRKNTAYCYGSFIGAGEINTIIGNNSFIGGGYNNTISTNSAFSVIAGGDQNKISKSYTTIAGGQCNTVSGCYSSVGGGKLNVVTGATSFIGGGCCNTTYGNESFISGGICNTVTGLLSSIVGGTYNTVSGCYSAIVGGQCNTASGNYTFVFGCGLNGCSNNTTYVQSLKMNGGTEALFTTSNTTLTTGLNSLYILPTVYDGAFIDYVAKCGANYRSGHMMSVWSGGTIVYNETTTVDIGDTNPLYFSMIISGGSPVFASSATTSGWCVKSIIRAI